MTKQSLPVLIGKEWRESIRQSRFLILLAPLIIFAILDPLMMKYLPQIIASQSPQLTGLVPVMGASDAIATYFKDISGLGLFVAVLTLMGTIADERSSGAYHILFSRRIQRWQVPLAKFLVHGATMLVGLLIGGLVTSYYIGVVYAPMAIAGLMRGLLITAVYFWFILAVVLFLSAVCKRGFAAGIGGILIAMLLPLAGYIPGIGKYLPHKLLGAAVTLANGGAAPSGLTAVIIISLVLSGLALAGAGVALERAEL